MTQAISNKMINTVYNEDCRATVDKMPNDFVDCIITAPPWWGLGERYHRDQIGVEFNSKTYVNELIEVFYDIHRVLKDKGVFWLNIGEKKIGSIIPFLLSDLDKIWTIEWFIPTNNRGWFIVDQSMPKTSNIISQEFLFLLTKSKSYYFDDYDLGDKPFLLSPTRIFDFCIAVGCPINGIVYDPFMGSGRTAISALKYGCKYIGSELNPDTFSYCQERINAWAQP